MSTESSLVVRPGKARRKQIPRTEPVVPMLYAGDRMTQPEFHRRYLAMPPHVKAELIGGIVYMPSPMRWEHGNKGIWVAGLLFGYMAATPGVTGADNATAILGEESEPQPDHILLLPPQAGGRSRINEKGYLTGPPELVIEVSHSTLGIDLHDKKTDYQKAGVLEYLVFCVEEKELRAFDLSSDKPLAPEADAIYRSKVFPGLWIDVRAIFAEDSTKMLKTLGRGLKSAEHAAFVKKLSGKPGRRKR